MSNQQTRKSLNDFCAELQVEITSNHMRMQEIAHSGTTSVRDFMAKASKIEQLKLYHTDLQQQLKACQQSLHELIQREERLKKGAMLELELVPI